MNLTDKPVFSYKDAIGYEPGVTRRDPSPVIRVDDVYYVWYSRTTVGPDGYSASIWTASSPDGHVWTEQGEALPAGCRGAFDEHAVFTPTILVAEGRYYLFYTAVPEPFTNDDGGPDATPTAIGVAVAASPLGPWVRCSDQPVLVPSTDPSRFDSMRVDDTCLVVRDGQYWMYYKGRPCGLSATHTRMGLAIAPTPTGPYVKRPENALVDGGHEVCCWPHGSGVAALFCSVGPASNTLQYSEDGIHFHVVADCVPPSVPGPFRADHFQDGMGPGITWGISMKHSDWPHLVRFDCNLAAE